MASFRRNRYKNNTDRNHHRNENGSKIVNDLHNVSNFIRKNAGRNNHNASKLVEKYSDLAREALLNGDKILSENYFQHADHFTRILSDQEKFKKPNNPVNTEENKDLTSSSEKKVESSLDKNTEKLQKIVSEAN